LPRSVAGGALASAPIASNNGTANASSPRSRPTITSAAAIPVVGSLTLSTCSSPAGSPSNVNYCSGASAPGWRPRGVPSAPLPTHSCTRGRTNSAQPGNDGAHCTKTSTRRRSTPSARSSATSRLRSARIGIPPHRQQPSLLGDLLLPTRERGGTGGTPYRGEEGNLGEQGRVEEEPGLLRGGLAGGATGWAGSRPADVTLLR
jgi:hypothetical protein